MQPQLKLKEENLQDLVGHTVPSGKGTASVTSSLTCSPTVTIQKLQGHNPSHTPQLNYGNAAR